MHKNLKRLSQIEGASLKLKKQKRSPFRPIHLCQKTTPKMSCDSPFKLKNSTKSKKPEQNGNLQNKTGRWQLAGKINSYSEQSFCSAHAALIEDLPIQSSSDHKESNP
jgi:hypothetical protein